MAEAAAAGVYNFKIPLIKLSLLEMRDWVDNNIRNQPEIQKRLVLVIVSIVLLLDNMLYMVIVPIVPIYFRETGVYEKYNRSEMIWKEKPDGTMYQVKSWVIDYKDEESYNGYLFASKAIVQIIVGPFSGTIIDRIGYEIPMVIGLIVMFLSTAVFALGTGYKLLFFARSLQGLGSAFADTSGLAMIADRFQEENERSKALGIAIAFISFGCLVAPPFGGTLYEWWGKSVPFVLLSLVCLFDGFLVFMVIQPKRRVVDEGNEQKGTPIYRLFMDPYIAVCAGALIMANVSLAFIEPTIAMWLEDEIEDITEREIGMVWLPAFFPHVAGVYMTIVLMAKFPRHSYILAGAGLAIEGISCIGLPYSSGSLWAIGFWLCTICFGVALIDTSLLPMLGYLVDTRYVSVYGSVYAIADISYNLAYAFGPIIAGKIMEASNFTVLNWVISLSNLIYVPILFALRKVYVYKAFEGEGQDMLDATGDGYEGMTSVTNEYYHATGQDAYGGAVDSETARLARSQAGEAGYGTNEYQQQFGIPANMAQPEYPAGRPANEKVTTLR